MTFLEKVKYLLPANRRRREHDMQEELESLQAMAEPKELGNMTLVAEDTRDVWTWRWLEHLAQDLRYAVRSVIHSKAFTLLAVLSLALGIGANTAVYSVMESILLRSLPVQQPESLVVMKWRTSKGNFTSASSKGMSWSTDGSYVDDGIYVGTQFPYPALKLFQDNNDVLSTAFCYFSIQVSVSIKDESEVVKGQYVSGNYFQGIGVTPAAGRLLVDDDDAAETASVAVLSYRFSQRRFGNAGEAVGETVRINNKPFTVVGVAPPEFFGAEAGEVPDVYVPMHANLLLQPAQVVATVTEQFLDANYYWIEIMGRLKPGVSLSQAEAVLKPQFHRFIDETTSTDEERSNPPTLALEAGAAGLDSMRRLFAQPIYVLMTMVGLILLIACANIANLLLTRAVGRRREIAIRLSMGAGRLRIIRQLLTESLLLSSIGGAFGVFVASWGIHVLTFVLANGRENFTLHAGMNWQVLGFSLGLSILTGLLFGLAPAIHATRVDIMPVLKESRTGASVVKTRQLNFSHVLIVAQIALSLCLLVSAGLFVRTVAKLHSIQTGLAREDILLFKINAREAGYEDSAFNRLYEDLRVRLSQTPGVRSVSFSTGPFPSGGGTMAPVRIPGVEPPPTAPAGGRPPNSAALFWVGPFFFDTMQIPRIAGRDFTERDASGAPRVAVINERLAKVFGLENPVGRSISLGSNTYEIVGLVRDALAFQLKEEQRPVIFFSSLQGRPSGSMTYEVRTAGNPLALGPIVRQMVRQMDSRIAVSNLKTQAAHIDEGISSEIALARLCTVFAVLALAIACVGLYGTVAFNVARRTGEIGIRMALGAQRGNIVWMILRQVCILSIVGLLIGTPLVFVGTRFVKSFLYGIEPNDPIALTAAVAIMLTAGLAAGYVPARRASNIHPMEALRHD